VVATLSKIKRLEKYLSLTRGVRNQSVGPGAGQAVGTR